MAVKVSAGVIEKFKTIKLENRNLRVTIIPELGGRIWELEDLNRNRQWIWHREDVPLKLLPMGSNYDDVWAGGWEELFPNDAAGKFEGRDLPDHGEWWTMNWDVENIVKDTMVVVKLTTKSTVINTFCIKEICLTNDASELSVNYRIISDEHQPFHFLFKQHLALDINQDCQVWLPGGQVQSVDPSFSTILPDGNPYKWPLIDNVDKTIDLSVIPPSSSKEKEFIYLWKLPQSWCGIIDKNKKASIKLKFDSNKFPYVWMFLTYGGWRNLYTTVLEPCTNMPKDLSKAVSLNKSARLEPGQEFKTTVSITLDGLEESQKNLRY